MRLRLCFFAALTAGPPAGCVVREACFAESDCAEGLTCDPATGACVEPAPECVLASDCGEVGFACVEGACVADCGEGVLTCPADMVEVCGAFCMDLWEASRPDATETSPGVDGSMATSRPGVLPWYATDEVAGMNLSIAEAACTAAGKRLCSGAEWKLSCQGMEGFTYPWGGDYDPAVCNGIDTYCTCDGEDPYPHCYETCGADFHVVPTGSFPACTSPWGAWDVSGNVWEIVASTDGVDHYRGGAYNCRDSEQNQRCDYDATWNPSAKGFRCCTDGVAR